MVEGSVPSHVRTTNKWRRRNKPGARPHLRLRITGFLVFVSIAAMLLRLYSLQVLNASSYKKAVVANEVRVVSIPAPRGLILDRSGKLLVGNRVIETVSLSRNAALQHPGVVGRLAALLGMTTAEVKDQLNNPTYSIYQPAPIEIGAPLDKVIYIREHASEFPGVTTALSTQTYYPNGAVAAHLLGYVGQINSTQLKALKGQGYLPGDQIGETGVEATYQPWLRGRSGEERLVVDAQGQVVGSLSRQKPVPGDNVILTLDLRLQKYVQQVLAQRIQYLHTHGFPQATGGAAVVMNPQNGSIYAMTSYPTYNPNEWVGGISYANYAKLTNPAAHEPLLNRAIAGLYTPGSTFKIATSTAALLTGLITPNTIIDDATGTFTIPNCVGKCTYHNAPGEGGLGPITISTAISASDDVFFYTLGYRFWVERSVYGEDPIQHWAHAYSLGSGTGIPIPGAATGQIDSPQLRAYQHSHYPKLFPYGGWYAGDNLELAFGQGETLITPIELADAYATFANGGTRYEPRLAEAIVNPQGKIVKTIKPIVTGHVNLPPADRAAMLKGFEGTITNPLGTAYYTFQGFPYSKFPIAGKTGTASVQHGQMPNSLFVAFGPVSNPKYVVAVVIDKAGYGATGSAPAARQIFQYLMTHPVGPPRL